MLSYVFRFSTDIQNYGLHSTKEPAQISPLGHIMLEPQMSVIDVLKRLVAKFAVNYNCC